jgi:ribosomal-protein-alanine N-acetyltransferase
MYELQRLRAEHDDAILEFELANRSYFARSISDRGDDYFSNFVREQRILLDEQATGACVFHVLIDEDSTVVGRFNLYDVDDGAANVGYRVAERVTGRGVATSALRELCRLAVDDYSLRTLRGAVSGDNVASRRVLEKVGFREDGPTEVGGRQGSWYTLTLSNDES